ncbi:hypothetical protein TWF694_007709 [Orbilia ellipsospora]|uniref:Sphingoid long-chain base transporter RSB1 n=1 Tax=Orbilia ellipsospora TaxID=2528407 RepID=A0AAV9XJ00_9PEZI
MSGNNDTEFCTLQTCPIEDSAFGYKPSLGFNAVLLALFTLSTISFVAVGIWKKTWGFLAATTLGGLLEIAGYVGRVGGSSDPFMGLGGQAFLIQICCLTIAPACYAAAIYLCLARIVMAFGADISRIKPRWYTYIFITCDVLSLVMQSVGGAMASLANTDSQLHAGEHISLAGLAWQVFTMTLFMVLCAEFALRCLQRKGHFDESQRALRESKRFRYFLFALGAATVFIYVRCVYRVAELSDGWGGRLMTNERYFLTLEGLMVILAVLLMNVFHPGICFEASYSSRMRAAKEYQSEMMVSSDGSTKQ